MLRPGNFDRFGVNLRVRRETGKKQEVKVHHDEGVANHIDPESCAVTRDGLGEALTGGRIGQPSSRERDLISGADAVLYVEGKTEGRDIASAPTTRRGRRPWHVSTLLVRDPGDLTVGQQPSDSVLLWSVSGR